MNFFQDLNLFGTKSESTATPAASPGVFDELATSVGSFADSAAATVSGWFNPSPASTAAAEPSLWDRFTDGVGDLGRGLSMEGLDGLRDLGGMLDRQQAIRTGPEEIPVGPGDHDRHDGHTPLARDTSNTGWTKGPDGKWSEAGDLGARPKTAFALSDYKYLKESETYFQNGADRTKYYDDGERAAHKMQAGVDGRLFDGQGKLANTAGSSALLKGSGLDTHIFAADRDGLFSADAAAENAASVADALAKKPGALAEARHHSSFSRGADVHAAGEMTAKNGWLKMVSNHSGHYKPDAKSNVQAIEALDAMGVNTDATIVHQIAQDRQNNQSHEYYNARAFVASGANEDLLQTHKEMFSRIHYGAQNVRGLLDPSPAAADEDVEEDVEEITSSLPAGRKWGKKPAPRPANEQSASELRATSMRDEALVRIEEGRPGVASTDKRVETSRFVDRDQTPFQERPNGASVAQVDVRGEAIAGWKSGIHDENAQHSRDVFVQLERDAQKAAAQGPAAAPVIAPAPVAPAPVIPPTQDNPYNLMSSDAASNPYNLMSANAASNPYNLMDASRAEAEDKAARKAAKAEEKRLAKEAEAAEAAARMAARANGDHLGQHDAPVSSARTDKLEGGWRRQLGRLTPLLDVEDPGANARAWRREAGAEEPAAAPVHQFVRDPRKGGHYKHEFDTYMSGAGDLGLPEGTRQRTKRYDAGELAARELVAGDSGLLMRASGEVMDTTAAAPTKLKGSDAGRNIFALDGYDVRSADQTVRRNKLYAADVGAEHDASLAAALGAKPGTGVVDHAHHSSFNGGGNLDGMGDFKVKQGFVQTLSNHSGHYEPDARSNMQTLKALDGMGINLDATKVENNHFDSSNTLVTETLRARPWLESKGNTGLLKTHGSLFGAINALGEGTGDAGIVPSQIPDSMQRAKTAKPSSAPAPASTDVFSNFQD